MSKALPGSLKAKKIKKNKGKKVIRNVLTLRPETFWPVISEGDAAIIKTILEKDLSVMSCWKPKVPWYILMKMTKEQRKAKIKEETDSLPPDKKEKIELARTVKKALTIGVNSSVRQMEQSKLLFCLIDSSEEAKVLIDKLLILAKRNQVVVGLLPNMKEVIKSIIGFSTFALGFKNTIEDKSSPIKNCLQIRDLLKPLNLSSCKTASVEHVEHNTDTVKKKVIQERLSDIYLYRSSNSERIFHPDSRESRQESNYIDMRSTCSIEIATSHRNFKRYTDQLVIENTEQIFESPLVAVTQSNTNKRRKK